MQSRIFYCHKEDVGSVIGSKECKIKYIERMYNVHVVVRQKKEDRVNGLYPVILTSVDGIQSINAAYTYYVDYFNGSIHSKGGYPLPDPENSCVDVAVPSTQNQIRQLYSGYVPRIVIPELEQDSDDESHIQSVSKAGKYVVRISEDNVNILKRSDRITVSRDEYHSTIQYLDERDEQCTLLPTIAKDFADVSSLKGDLLLNVTTEFKSPNCIQSQMIPAIADGYDVVVVSQKDSGKTVSVILTAVTHIEKRRCENDRANSSTVLIVVENVTSGKACLRLAKNYGKHTQVSVVLIDKIGIRRTITRTITYSDYDIVIGTPKQIQKAISKAELNVANISLLVYKDVELLLATNCINHIQDVPSTVKFKAQVIIITTTATDAVKQFALRIMNRPLMIRDTYVYFDSNLLSDNQSVVVVNYQEKNNQLEQYLRRCNSDYRCVVYCQDPKRVFDFLMSLEFRCVFIYSEMDIDTLNTNKLEFLRREATVLVVGMSTAIGLNLNQHIEKLIFFNLPGDLHEYLRLINMRITNDVLTIVTDHDKHLLPQLADLLTMCNTDITEQLSQLMVQ